MFVQGHWQGGLWKKRMRERQQGNFCYHFHALCSMQYTYVYCPIAQQGTIRYLTVTKNRIRQIYDLGPHLQLLLALAAMKHLHVHPIAIYTSQNGLWVKLCKRHCKCYTCSYVQYNLYLKSQPKCGFKRLDRSGQACSLMSNSSAAAL